MGKYRLASKKIVTNVVIAASVTSACIASSSFARSVNADVLEEVIVTATKRETSLQSTSESIQVLGENMISNKGLVDFESYLLSIPSLSVADNRGPGNRRYSIRGVQSAGEPLVGVYLDDVALLGSPGESLDPGGSQPDIKLWDVDRIEVLKGPQGTLYGNGSVGGTIRVITKNPDASQFDAAVQATYANISEGDTSHSVSGMINVPIIEDTLALRASLYAHDNGGYIDELYLGVDDANDEDTDGGRIRLDWVPTNGTLVSLSGVYQNTETGAESEVYEGFGRGDSPSAAQLSNTGFKDKVEIYSLKLEHSFSWADFMYVGSYQDRTVERRNDQTRFIVYGLAGVPHSVCPESSLKDKSCFDIVNAGPFGEVVPVVSWGKEKNKSTTHELRLKSSDDGAFEWMLGYYYEDRDTAREGQVAVTNEDGDIEFGSDGAARKRLFARNNKGTREQRAVFGNISYEFLPGWTFSTSARWFQVERTEQQVIIQNFGPGPVGPQAFKKYKNDGAVPRFKLSWQATDNVLLYALASEGFRVGGPNQPVGFAASAPSFKSDSLWDYEFGWKTTLFDGAMHLNGAVYYLNWSDIQYLTTDKTGAFTLIGNAGDVDVKGAELELQAVLLAGLEVSAGIGYTDATFFGEQPEQALLENQTRDGDRLPGVPKWSSTVFAQYTFNLSNGLGIFVNGDWAYRSDTTTGFRPEAGNYRELDSYNIVNLRTGLDLNQWKLMFQIKNTFDERAEVSGRVVHNEPFQYATFPPRTYDLSVSYHFR